MNARRMRVTRIARIVCGLWLVMSVLAAVLALVIVTTEPAQAQVEPQVEVLTGRIEAGEVMVYNLPELIAGESLYVRATMLSGNLDPFVAIAGADVDAYALLDDFHAAVDQAIENGRDPVEVVPEFADAAFLAWNDDTETSYDAAVQWIIESDGEYRLLLFTENSSFGEYQLTLGINAPEVLTGEAEATGDSIALLDSAASHIYPSVEGTSVELTSEKTSTYLFLQDFSPGETVYIFVETLSGDMGPVLELRDYGGKLLRTANASGKDRVATLQHEFTRASYDNTLIISTQISDETPSPGEFRVLVGINAPDVLDGTATTVGRSVIRQPINISVGVRLEQVVGIDLKAQTIEVVASVRMKWIDQRLAFRPDQYDKQTLILRGTGYTDFLADNADRWPEFSIFNQEGRRFAQNQYGLIESDGQSTYFERFSVVIHDTSMDYKKYPFDSQEFNIDIDSLFPGEVYVYTPDDSFNQIGRALGEEEWIITSYNTEVSTTPDFGSRFSFIFPATRHMDYYILRIFIPLGLIMLVSWGTFFLRDYTMRISLAGANLLLFVAFNFTLGSDLPRLGYATFMDAILMTMFLMTSLVILYNFALRAWEVGEKGERALFVDKYSQYAYLIMYFIAILTIVLVFLV